MKTINGIEVQDWEVVDTDKVSKVATFIIDWVFEHRAMLYNGTVQMFDNRNIAGDYMVNILVDTNLHVMIDYSENGYIEVFGVTESEFKMISDWCIMMNAVRN